MTEQKEMKEKSISLKTLKKIRETFHKMVLFLWHHKIQWYLTVIKRYWTNKFCAWTMSDTLGDGEGYMEEFHGSCILINWWWPDDHWGCDIIHSQPGLACSKTRRILLSYRTIVRTEWDHMCEIPALCLEHSRWSAWLIFSLALTVLS